MDLYTLPVFAVAVPAVLFAGISKGGFGSGAAFASASILAIVLPPALALGIMLPLLMLIDVTSLRAYWRQWDWPAARVLLIGSIPGTLLGAWFFASVQPDTIRLLIGVISIAFVAWQLAQNAGWNAGPRAVPGQGAGLLAGMGVGFTSFVSHAGGPVAALYLLGKRLAKTQYQATTVLVFWAVNVMKAGLYTGMGIFSWSSITFDLMLAPVAVLGTYLGIKLHKIVPERLFFAVTYVLLTVTGAKLIWDGLT